MVNNKTDHTNDHKGQDFEQSSGLPAEVNETDAILTPAPVEELEVAPLPESEKPEETPVQKDLFAGPDMHQKGQRNILMDGLKNKEQWSKEDEIRFDKLLRQGLDWELQKLKIVEGVDCSRERALAVTKVQEAIMWLGMDLKRLKDTKPYPTSYDSTSVEVEATADNLKL